MQLGTLPPPLKLPEWHPGWTRPSLPWLGLGTLRAPSVRSMPSDLTTKLPRCPRAVLISSLSTGSQSCFTPLERCQLSVRSAGRIDFSETGLVRQAALLG